MDIPNDISPLSTAQDHASAEPAPLTAAASGEGGAEASARAAPPSGFGRGWIPVGRDIGLPGDEILPSMGRGTAGTAVEGALGLTQRWLEDAAPLHQPLAGAPPRAGEDRVGWTPARKVRFLDRMAEHGNVRVACAEVGISAEAAYRLRRRDAVFAEGWTSALGLARVQAQQVVADRALNGVEEEIWFRGELVGKRRRFDARLLLAHVARLDKLAEEAPHTETRAGRFDEILALVGGEAFPEDMIDDSGEDEADPLLPMGRERYVLTAAEAARQRAYWQGLEAALLAAEAQGRDTTGWLDQTNPLIMLNDEECETIAEAQEAAELAESAAAAERYDDWLDRAAACADAALGEGAGELPYEVKSLNPPQNGEGDHVVVEGARGVKPRLREDAAPLHHPLRGRSPSPSRGGFPQDCVNLSTCASPRRADEERGSRRDAEKKREARRGGACGEAA